MKKIKRILALALSLAALFSAALSAGAEASPIPVFQDVPSDAWYQEYVTYCAKERLLKGRGNGIYAPNESLTLAELAVATHNLFSYTMNDYSLEFPPPYAMDPNQLILPPTSENYWYAQQVHLLWARGMSLETYAPDGFNKPASRRILVEVLALYFDGDSFGELSAEEAVIADVSPDSSYYEFLQVLYQAGVLRGKGNDCFCPDDSLTRAELAAVFTRIAKLRPTI